MPEPPLWPWLALAGAVAGLTAVVLVRGRPALLLRATVGCGIAAAAATIAIAVGFAVDPNASGATWAEGANEVALALVGLAVVAFGSHDARVAASGLLGLLGIFAGAMKLEVLNHGLVLSAFPALAVRIAVVLALSAGAAAMLLAMLAFESSFGRTATRPRA